MPKSSKTKSAGQIGMTGGKMTTNPSNTQRIKNKIARKRSINLALEKPTLPSEKRAYLEKALRRLDLEIKLAQGDY